MRRVSIGLEPEGSPDILILDEPTSGLDSVSAARVASVLRALADDEHHPVCVVASIHQPSSRVYHEFGRVLLLGGGKALYEGPGGLAPSTFFSVKGVDAPREGYNVAEHLLNIASEYQAGETDLHSPSSAGSGGSGDVDPEMYSI